MKALLHNELGSWSRVVTKSDGAGRLQDFLSNANFNWLTDALLWYGHACIKGSDNDLNDGTAKSAEGYLGGILSWITKAAGRHADAAGTEGSLPGVPTRVKSE